MITESNPYQLAQPKGVDSCLSESLPDSNQIVYGGQLSVDDAIEASRLAKTRKQRIHDRIGQIVLAAMLFSGTGFAWKMLLNGDEEALLPAIGMLLLDAFVVLIAFAHPASIRKRAEKLYAQGVGLYTPTHGRVNQEGIVSMANDAELRINWSAFSGYRFGKDVALLFQTSSEGCLIFAKSKFNSEPDWNRFLRMVKAKLAKLSQG